MSGTLVSIAGVDGKMEKLLSERAGIGSLKKLWESTRTPKQRAEVAEKTRIPLDTINIWAAQADLLRVKTMSYDMAYELIEADIYSVDLLRETDAKEILEKLQKENARTKFTEESIVKLQNAEVVSADKFVCESSVMRDRIKTKDTTPSIYSGLSNVIAELGTGVAYAQRQLDLASMDIQNEILNNDRMYGMGLQATWYAMPEVEFTMKMDYSVYEEKREDGTITKTDINMLPSNATYSNLFKSSKKEESSVRLRIVPIPANDKFITRRYMPDLSSVATIGGLKLGLEQVGISTFKTEPEDAFAWDDDSLIKVIDQKPKVGTLLELGVVPKIDVERIVVVNAEDEQTNVSTSEEKDDKQI